MSVQNDELNWKPEALRASKDVEIALSPILDKVLEDGMTFDLFERVDRVASAEAVQSHVDSITERLNDCELQINTLREQLTRGLLEEIARRFRDYFDTVQDPVSDEEFYKDLQTLLFG